MSSKKEKTLFSPWWVSFMKKFVLRRKFVADPARRVHVSQPENMFLLSEIHLIV